MMLVVLLLLMVASETAQAFSATSSPTHSTTTLNLSTSTPTGAEVEAAEPNPSEVRSDLRTLIARTSRSSEKEAILDRLSDLRRARGRGDPEGFNAYTDACLEVLDAQRGPVSTRLSKLPAVCYAVPSFRVNMLLLRRVMELTDASVDPQMRRNMLAVSLAQLKNRRGVSSLLREAKRR